MSNENLQPGGEELLPRRARSSKKAGELATDAEAEKPQADKDALVAHLTSAVDGLEQMDDSAEDADESDSQA